MKTVMIILILILTYLFYPFYDLYTKEDAFSESFSLEGKGYRSQGKCAEAAEAVAAEIFRCRKRTIWSKMFSTYTQYDPAIREIRQEHPEFN